MLIGRLVFGQDIVDTISTSQKIIIRNISFTGNKITKERIIRRELMLKENDTLTLSAYTEKVELSHQNLMNTSLFNFVTIDTLAILDDPPTYDVNIDFLERWYIWPVPIFELSDRNLSEWLKKMDLNRVNYGLVLTWNNFRGRREKVLLKTIYGYDEKYELSYQIPYINHNQTLGIGFSGGFSRNHEISYNSDDNKEVYYKTEKSYARKLAYGYAELYLRKDIHNKHWFKLMFSDLMVDDSIPILNPHYSFGPSAQNNSLSFYYQYRSDFRDYQAYPLNGHYFDVEMDKAGLGIMSNPKVNALHLRTNIRKYFNINGRFYWASGFTGKVSPLGEEPYYYMRGLGYGRDFVRGYEFYVVDAQHYAILKNNLKFELLKTKVIKFPLIPTEKFNKLPVAFYMNLFADFGYASDSRNYVNNPLSNEILTGYGVGFDFITYYDFVIRVEYTVNKMGQGGFYIHLMPSI